MSDEQPVNAGRPRSDAEQELGFQIQRPVKWLSPEVLAGTGLKVLLSELFGSYADKRELQAVLPATVHRRTDSGELWFDYVADIGDGFDSTYSVASVLARREVEVDGARLPRGELLVFGGDEVYPSASTSGYEDRSRGPYRAALPMVTDGNEPTVFALPGNHDWYDGLTAFLRLFAQGRSIGGWRTEQSRSYFAVQLPQRWWMFAVDTQLGSYLDEPQLRYLRSAAEELRPGDGVILCWATPGWVNASAGKPGAYDPIEFFDREIIRPTGAVIRVMLSGDTHHYARYTERGGTAQCFTCGTGGAYLAATHRLPQQIEVPPPASRMRNRAPTRTFDLRTRFPSLRRSQQLAAGILRLPWLNPGFAALTGGLHTLFMATLIFALSNGSGAIDLRTVRSSFPAVLMAIIMVYAAIRFARSENAGAVRFRVAGTLHGLAHVAVGVGWSFAVWAMHALAGNNAAGLALTGLVVVATFVVVGLVGTEITALYLLLASYADININEVFAGQSIDEYKGFLRLHIGADGVLTVYPLRLSRIVRRWVADADGGADDPWLRPASGALTAEAIEPAVRVPREAAQR